MCNRTWGTIVFTPVDPRGIIRSSPRAFFRVHRDSKIEISKAVMMILARQTVMIARQAVMMTCTPDTAGSKYPYHAIASVTGHRGRVVKAMAC